MKIGVIGLGNIAQKAYLPTYSECRHLAEFVLATRNPETRQKIANQYGFTETVGTIEELIEAKIDACFVHVATKVHGAVVRQLLQAGIHVFVDKPLSEELAEVKELQALAAAKNLRLMVGFNRRFAPYTEVLKNIPEKQTIFIKKNRINTTRETSFMMYDLFLHVVDTAVYLAEGPLHVVQSKLVEENGHLKRAILQLETEQTTIVCSMDLHSGANTETFEVTSPTGTYRLENLTHLTIQTEEEYQVKEMGDWTPTLEKRGFYQMVTAFIQAIQKPQEQELKQEKVYESHALCEEMLRQQQRYVL